MNSPDVGGEHLQRGIECEQQGDIAGAEAAYVLADRAGSADAALQLGALLKRRGDPIGAQEAYRRGEARGDPRCSCNLGVLLEELGDAEGARLAYLRADAVGFPGGAYALGQLLYARGDFEGSLAANRRADELGDPDAAFNLGVLLAKRGDLVGAEAAYARAEGRGILDGATALGKCLRSRNDLSGAEAAFRRADERGDATGAFELGALLYDRGDHHGALAAFERAALRGYSGAADLAQRLKREMTVADSRGPEPSASWIALRSALEILGVTCLSDTAMSWEIPRGDSGRMQRVWISYEVIAPDYEIVRLHSPFAQVGHVELDTVVRDAGSLTIGGIGFTASVDASGQDGGLLSIGSSFPLAMLDPNDVGPIAMYLAVLAAAADQLEARWSRSDLF